MVLGKIFGSLLLAFIFLIIPNKVLAQDGKRVEIDLDKQMLYGYEGNALIYSSLISSGRFSPTPDGTFHPYFKTPSIRMVGGNKLLGTYYDLPNVPPNVPYDVFFYQGYALHGTYWHSNFGHPMSHGCINLPTYAAKEIYSWIDYSTPIHIYGAAPI